MREVVVPALVGTTDGGRHWRRLGAPPMLLPDNHNHVALTFVSDRVAYVSDGVHVRTTRDGGASWHPVGLVGAREPFYLSKITETGGRVFAVLTTYGEGRGSTRLYSATAGSPVLVPVPGFAVTGSLTYGDLAVGGGLQVALGADYATEEYWTSRDGVRFTRADPPCPAGIGRVARRRPGPAGRGVVQRQPRLTAARLDRAAAAARAGARRGVQRE